jgi:holo-[acyl-carrier protein] synthase
MIYGIGTDIVDINRFQEVSEHFLKKVYTEAERDLFRGKPQSLAGNFAAKEAVVKAFGTGFKGIDATDIEVLREDNGAPYVNLHGKALALFQNADCTVIKISISHNKDNACAFAVLEVC